MADNTITVVGNVTEVLVLRSSSTASFYRRKPPLAESSNPGMGRASFILRSLGLRANG